MTIALHPTGFDIGEKLERMALGGEARPLGPGRARELWAQVMAGQLALVARHDAAGLRLLAVERSGSRLGVRGLTGQERRVALRSAAGQSLKVIAFELGLSLPAVSQHLARALPKLGMRDRLELAHLLGPESAEPSGPGAFPVPAGLEAHVMGDGADALLILSFALSEPAPPSGLSLAEREVVRLASRGLSNAQIARERTTSVRTVANQLSSVFGKLRIGSRMELVLLSSRARRVA